MWNVKKKLEAAAAQADGQGIPIVGLPFEVTSIVVMASVVCKCEATKTLLVASNTPAVCPSCRKAYVVAGLQLANGQFSGIQISVSHPAQADDLAAAASPVNPAP